MDLSPSLSRIQSRNPAQSRNPIRSLNRLRQNLRPLTRYNQQGGQNSEQKHGKPLERGLHDVVNSFLNQLSWHVTYTHVSTQNGHPSWQAGTVVQRSSASRKYFVQTNRKVPRA